MKSKELTDNCSGCKWLDQVSHKPLGEGYCAMVIRSSHYQSDDRRRYSNEKRCELYESGDFTTRWDPKA